MPEKPLTTALRASRVPQIAVGLLQQIGDFLVADGSLFGRAGIVEIGCADQRQLTQGSGKHPVIRSELR